MAIPSIQIGQATVSGSPGESVAFLEAGVEVEVSDVANPYGSSYGTWELEFPFGCDVYLTASGSNPTYFTPPKSGTYNFFATTAGGEKSFELDPDYPDVKISSQGGAAVKFENGFRAPGRGETNQFDGWDVELYRIIETADRDLNHASYLRTDTGVVLVSGVVPETGQVLIASDESTASWQSVASLGEGIEIRDDGTTVSGNATCIDFVGGGVTATVSGSCVRVDTSGGMQHIKTYRVSSSDRTSITFDNLGGGGIYILEWEWEKSSNDVNIELRPNGLTSNQNSTREANGSETSINGSLAIARGTFEKVSGSLRFNTRAGRVRRYRADIMIATTPFSGNSNMTPQQYIGVWNDTSTVVTSLEIHCTEEDGIHVGSEFRLYELTEGEGRVEEI